MANLLINTTVGGNAVITTSNIGTYALTSLPSHNHDDRYFTETESDGRFQPLENQRLSTTNSPTFANVYATEWFRNYNNQGIYNQTYGTHFYSNGGTSWAITGSGGNVQLEFRSNHQSTIRGFVYADTSNQIGFLNNAGDWSLRTNSSKDTQIYGALTVGSGTSADIYMTDTDETTRRIHTNSGRIGFLNAATNWGAYCDNTGNWFSDHSMRAPIFYDSADAAYYVDPNGTSHVVNIEAVGFVGLNGNQTRDKLRVWDSGTYTIGMKSGYDYGHLGTDEYAMSFQMNDNSGRGFWWGDTGHNDNQGAASLTTDGRMVIAKSLSIGEGEAVVSPSSVPLYVTGTTSGLDVLAVDGVNGRLFTVTDDLSDSLFSVNTIAGLPVIEAFADNTVKIGKYGSNSITISGSKIAINSDTVDANFPFYVGDRSVAGSRYSLTNKGMGFNLADNYAQLQLYGGNGAYIDFVTTSGQDSAGRIMWDGNFNISGTTYFANNIYTYTLFDRNDNAYYLDMNGTSRLGTLNINQLSVYGNTYLGDGNGDEVHINDILRVGATDSGDAHFYFGEGGSAGSDYGSHWYWDSGYTFTWNTRNNGTDTALFDYVTNDTTYLNWRRNFHMQNREINFASQLHFNGGTRFVAGDSNYLTFRPDSTSVGGIQVKDGNSTLRGYSAYFDSAGFGLLNSTGGWGIRLNPGNVGTELFYAGDWRIRTRSDGAGVSGNLYTDQNYGHGLVGVYASDRYQGVFAMGDSYKLSADGTSSGSLYGIAWTHTNVGGQSKSGLGHQALFMANGSTQTAIGYGIWTVGLITTTDYGTSANWKSAYDWGNHASAGYQSASTAITTSNIGSQSVSYATTAGSLTSMNISQFTNNSGYLTSLPSHNHDDRYYTETEIDSQIGTRLYQASGVVIDVNAFNSTGLYRGSTGSWTNRPTITDNSGALLQIDTHPGNYHTQLFFDSSGTRLYLRSAIAGSWNSWVTMWHSGNLTNLNQLSNGPGYLTSITSGNVTTALGFTPYNSTNPSGYISSITSGNVTTALGYTPYNDTNPNGYITGISFANVSSKPTTVAGYGITDAITTANIGSQSVSYAATAGSAPNAGNVNDFYNVTAGLGNGLKFWNSDNYKISMGASSLYYYGPVTDYSIKMQMNDSDTGRGFTWGRLSYAPIAALNSTSGDMEIAGYFKSYGYRSNSNVGGVGSASWHPDGIYCGSTMWQYGSLNKNNTGIYNVSEMTMYSGPTLSTYNTRNLIVRALDNNADVGILGQKSGGGFAFQIYGTGSSYGFLNGTWAAWDIRKAVSGAMYMNDNDSYYLQTNSTSNFYALNIQGNAVVHAGNIGSQSVSNADSAGGLAVHSSRNNEANKIVRTDVNGYLQTGWINTPSGAFGSAINKIYCSDDDYVRYQTPANFISNLGLITTSSIGNQSVSYAVTAGSAGSVTGLTLTSSANNLNPDNVTQNQIGYNTSVSLFGQTDGGLYSSAYSSSWIHQIYGDFRTGQIAIRGKNSGSWQAWRVVLDSSNYTSYAPSLTGSGASGTWGINISGNAATVTNFSGTHSGASSGTNTGDQTNISGNAATATNVAYSGLTGTVPTWNQNTTGNAATATYATTAGSAPANGGNSTTVGGYAVSGSVGANTVVIRDVNGYIYANYINSNVSETENPTINSFYTSNGDGWLRKSSVAHVKSQLGLGSLAYSSATIPTNNNQLTNGEGYITGINSGNVTTALGFTPYNATNPSGYISSYSETDTLATVTGRGATFSSNITSSNGAWIKFSSAAETDSNDGKIGSGVFASGLNIVGAQTSAGLGRQIRLWGSVITNTGDTFYHSGNIPTWNQNTTGSAATATSATSATQLSTYGTITSDNWNTYFVSGQLIASSVNGHSGSNRPTNHYDYGAALSYGVSGGALWQMYFPENSGNSAGSYRNMAYRTGWNGAWGDWRSPVNQIGQVATVAGSNGTGVEIHSNVGYNQDPLTYFLMRGQADSSWKALKIRLTGDAGGQDIEFRRIAENSADARIFYVPRGANQVIFDYTVVQPSDSRLKDNLTPITNPVDKIKSLRGVEFDWNSGEHVGTHDVGLIAQDVEAVLPEAVTTQEDGYKNLAYTKVIPLLVEAMKEQQTMIEALRAEVELLKNK